MTGLFKPVFLFFTLTTCFCHFATGQSNIAYDIVLIGGRVIDPETKLDTIKNVGIINNRIAQISSERLKGKQEINVSGLVVAPGFIDLHIHGRTNKEQEYQLHDGLTTALELEWGIENLKEWYITRQSKALSQQSLSPSQKLSRGRCVLLVRNVPIGDVAENKRHEPRLSV